MVHDHDTGYKMLFSHPEMVRDLLTGFVPGAWLKEADYSTLTLVHGSYVTPTDDPRQRHDDLVWKVQLKRRWLYVYLLLEFQSRSDPLMALRMMVYVGLLQQDIARRGELTSDGKLPPVLPIVLYNGPQRWAAPLTMRELAASPPPGLGAYLPQCRYLLLDEGSFGPEVLAPLRNLIAALFRLETQRGLEQVRAVVDALIEWLHGDDQRAMRRAFAIWIKRMLRAQLPGAEIDGINDLQEVRSMLAENIKTWFEEYTEKGFQQGLLAGQQQGHQQGRQEGRQEGLQQGHAEGERQALKRLLLRRFGPIPPDLDARIAQATPAQIEAWFDRAIDAPVLYGLFDES